MKVFVYILQPYSLANPTDGIYHEYECLTDSAKFRPLTIVPKEMSSELRKFAIISQRVRVADKLEPILCHCYFYAEEAWIGLPSSSPLIVGNLWYLYERAAMKAIVNLRLGVINAEVLNALDNNVLPSHTVDDIRRDYEMQVANNPGARHRADLELDITTLEAYEAIKKPL